MHHHVSRGEQRCSSTYFCSSVKGVADKYGMYGDIIAADKNDFQVHYKNPVRQASLEVSFR